MTSTGPVEHPIAERRTHSGDGRVALRLIVHCERRRGAVELATCSDCEHCLSLRLPSGGRRGRVICAGFPRDPEAPAAATGLGRSVREAMQRDVVCVTGDVPLAAAEALLLEGEPGVLPVVDHSGHPIGVVSMRELLQGRRDAGGAAPPRTVRDVMNPVVCEVFEQTDLARAAALMAAAGAQAVPVVLADGSVGGMLSTLDVLRAIGRGEREPDGAASAA